MGLKHTTLYLYIYFELKYKSVTVRPVHIESPLMFLIACSAHTL